MPAPFTKTVRGVEVPTIAIGVFEVEPGETEETVADALAAGYRHVDTATAYGNEEEVGRGLARSGVDRDDVWVTTKVWLAHQDRVVLLPRSTDPGRRRENLAALEIDLTDEETARIDELSERRERNFDPPWAPDWRD